MFYYISGNLSHKTERFAVVDVQGLGYKVFMSVMALANIGELGTNVKIFTYMNIREDAMDIYGFLSPEELSMFEMLISVSGVGPKAGLSVLATMTVAQFALAIATNDFKSITAAQGIGSKTAQRIILELKDKIKSEHMVSSNKNSGVDFIDFKDDRGEAISALIVLGYAPTEAKKAINAVYEESMGIEAMIKGALRLLNK